MNRYRWPYLQHQPFRHHRGYTNGRLIVSQRNRFFEGDELEVVEPGKKPYKLVVEDLYNLDDDEKVDVANKATYTYSFKCDKPAV